MTSRIFAAAMMVLCGVGVTPVYADQVGQMSDPTHLQGTRTVPATVLEVRGDEIKIDMGEVQPRFLPLNAAKEKGFSDLKKGDRLQVMLNDENLIVDYHREGQGGPHTILHGRIAEDLTVGHDHAVIETKDGKRMYEIRSQARSAMAAIPTGVDADFLLDETGKIADVTFKGKDQALQAAKDKAPQPIKGNQRRVEGTVVKALDNNKISIRTADGKERSFEVRQLLKDRLANVDKGAPIVLLVDQDDKVVDVAQPPRG